MEAGGVSLDARKHTPWYGTFGSLLLCTKGGARVDIRSIDYHYALAPVRTRALIREVPDPSARAGRPIRWAPIGSYRQSVKDIRGQEMLSTSIEPASGAAFATPCSNGFDGPFTELLTEMEVGTDGGWIDGITINYTSGGSNYDVSVDYNYSACGRAIAHEWFCDPDIDGTEG